jgi:hypothetical protein
MASTHAFNSALSSVDWIVMRLESDIPIYPDFVFVLDEEEYDVVYMKDETEKELCAETNKVVLEKRPNFDLPFGNAFAVELKAGSHAMRFGLDMVNDLIWHFNACNLTNYRINDIHFDIIDGLSMIVFTVD